MARHSAAACCDALEYKSKLVLQGPHSTADGIGRTDVSLLWLAGEPCHLRSQLCRAVLRSVLIMRSFAVQDAAHGRRTMLAGPCCACCGRVNRCCTNVKAQNWPINATSGLKQARSLGTRDALWSLPTVKWFCTPNVAREAHAWRLFRNTVDYQLGSQGRQDLHGIRYGVDKESIGGSRHTVAQTPPRADVSFQSGTHT